MGKQKAKNVSRRDIVVLLDNILERGSPIAANRTLAVTRRMFNFAVERDIIPNTPCYGFKAPTKENRRNRVLSPDEIRSFWKGLDGASISELSRLALKILEQIKAESDNSKWLFPSPNSDKHMTPEAIDHAIRKNEDAFKNIKHFTPHDLRRTAASLMTSLGISRLVVSKLLNHVENSVTAIYDRHSYDKEKKQAMEVWGTKLRAIVF